MEVATSYSVLNKIFTILTGYITPLVIFMSLFYILPFYATIRSLMARLSLTPLFLFQHRLSGYSVNSLVENLILLKLYKISTVTTEEIIVHQKNGGHLNKITEALIFCQKRMIVVTPEELFSQDLKHEDLILWLTRKEMSHENGEKSAGGIA